MQNNGDKHLASTVGNTLNLYLEVSRSNPRQGL